MADGVFESFIPTKHDFAGKVDAMHLVARRLNINLANIAFIGDAMNDQKALAGAGLSIAFCEDATAVSDASMHHVATDDLMDVVQLILDHNKTHKGILRARKAEASPPDLLPRQTHP